jgi:hypothetical protein
MNRRLSLAAVTLLASLCLAACSTTTASSTAHTTPMPPSTARHLSVCFGSMPPEWASALSTSTVNLPLLHWFSTEAVDDVDDTAYGTYHEGDKYGVGAVNLATGHFRAITAASSATWGGVLWMSSSNPRLAWAESNRKLTGGWDLRLWNTKTGESRTVASSRLLAGQYTFPVVVPNYVAWSQATSNTSADIRIYRFSTRTTSVLDSGRLSPPVLAGTFLVWSKFVAGNTTEPTFQMVDAVTLSHQSLPASVRVGHEVVVVRYPSIWAKSRRDQALDLGEHWAISEPVTDLWETAQPFGWIRLPRAGGPRPVVASDRTS